MLLLLGITVGLIGLLILNILLIRKNRAEQKLRDKISDANKEEVFLKNCLHFQLSDREIDVLRLILAGHTYRATGETLFISGKTVDTHLRSIYRKSGVKNKVELMIAYSS